MAGRRGRAAPVTGRGRTALGIATVSSGMVLAAFPVFLVSGLAVQIRAELGFSEAALGAAVSGAFLTGACAAPFMGRLADRAGHRASILGGSALSALSLAGIAVARGWGGVALMLVVSGLGIALSNPGIVILVARAVPVERRGLAFGANEASIPATTLVAGLAVPLVALTLGWRWALLLGVVPLGGLLLLLPRVALLPPARPAGGAGEPVRGPATAPVPVDGGAAAAPRSALLLVTVAAGLGIGAASGVGVFLTQSAVAMGVAPGPAGLLLAAGSVAGIVTRVVTGLLADRDGREQFGRISWMLAAGALAMALGASGAGPLLVVATLGAFAGVWGWTGLLFLSLVRASPGSPGGAAGMAVAGLAAGNGLGPLAFGAVAQAASFPVAWVGSAAAALLAAVLFRLARAWLRRAGAAT